MFLGLPEFVLSPSPSFVPRFGKVGTEGAREEHERGRAIAQIAVTDTLPPDRHPERQLKASFKAFEEAELPRNLLTTRLTRLLINHECIIAFKKPGNLSLGLVESKQNFRIEERREIGKIQPPERMTVVLAFENALSSGTLLLDP
ncbi:unnamed protein product [Fraxinus pennsylvanica]|uniref:Coiled-coil domain-containing protein n=1 Tax=Fraxinus pennsylvanica TaxID=56036 RepID=A0AAD1ZWV1_9LAMI|nr:unnamed protein product [Fraxinus pennsylvanica]